MDILTNQAVGDGLDEYVLCLDLLYSDKKDRYKFESKWSEFYESDKNNAKVFEKKGDKLIYLSESWIPTKRNNRLPALLLFGNPAPHSVNAQKYFAYEGDGREHRVWRIFRDISLLDIKEPVKKNFYELNYNSPLRLSMEVYFSMPSAPSDPKWSGVGGLYRLLGKRALDLIEQYEQKRMKKVIKKFLGDDGIIIGFQKDAYNGVATNSNYSLKCAMNGKLVDGCKFNSRIKVFGVAPTRFLQGKRAKKVLRNFITMY